MNNTITDPQPVPNATISDMMGCWAILPEALNAISAELKKVSPILAGPFDVETEVPEDHFAVTEDGIGFVNISGMMIKPQSWMGGTSTVALRRALRAMSRDEAVKAIIVKVDSPGGNCAGTSELYDDIREIASVKPVHAFVDDTAASAALWAISGATSISINPAGEMGSIGTVMVLQDLSEAYAKEGIKTIIVSSGSLKGAGAPGTELDDEYIAQWQKSVDRINKMFLSAIHTGRHGKITQGKVKEINTGEMFGADEAVAMGLADKKESLDALLHRVRGKARRQSETRRRSSAMRARVALERLK